MTESFRINLKTILNRPGSGGMRLRFPSLPQPALTTLTCSLMHVTVAIRVDCVLTGRPARANAAAGI